MKIKTFLILFLFAFQGFVLELGPPQLIDNFLLSSGAVIQTIFFDQNSSCYFSIVFLEDRLYLKNHNKTDSELEYILKCQISTEIRSRNQRIYILCKDKLYLLFNFPNFQIQKSQFTFTTAFYHIGFDFSQDEETFSVTNFNMPVFDLAKKDITLTIEHFC